MDGRYNDISDILDDEKTLPINWDASGKMSLSKTATSEDNLINLQDDRFDGTLSPINFPRFNLDHEKTINKSAFRSMPDLSAPQHQTQPAARAGPAAVVGRITSTTSLLGGRVTPTSVCTSTSSTRHYTLKEYEQELDKLQKENFNLKVRIWHLEEEFRRRGTVTDDMAKRDLENQISEISSKLEEKERMLKESLDILNQLKASCHRQLLEFKRDHEAEIDTIRRQFSERIHALEDLVRTTNEQLESVENENHRLSQMVSFGTGKPSLSGESDSDVSLLSHRERQVFDLKARVALLERELQSRSAISGFDGDMEELLERTPRRDGTLSGVDGKTLNYDEIESEALKTEIKQKEELIIKFRLEIEDRDDFIARLRADVDEKDAHIARMETEAGSRDEYIGTLETSIKDKNHIIAGLESNVQMLKGRVKKMVENRRTPTNNSDDEKLRQLEEELSIQRANALKNTKIIQGLLKQIKRNERTGQSMRDAQCGASLFLTPPAEDGSGDYDDNDVDPDSSTFMAWLNETAGLHIRQHDDLFRRRVAELQTVSETLYDRLKRVADNLEEYAHKLRPSGVSVDSSKILSALSNDLSMLRHDLQASFVDATYSITAALARGAVGETSALSQGDRGDAEEKARDMSFNDSRLQENFGEDRPDAFHLNFSDVSRHSNRDLDRPYRPPKSVAIQLPLSNKSAQTDSMLVQFASPKRVSTGTVTTPMHHDTARHEELRQQFERDMDIMRQEFDRNMLDLREKNERLERYAKKIKALYRKATKCSTTDLETQLDQLLSTEQWRLENIEGVVKQLEENNRVFADDLQAHERHDKKMKETAKREANKVKELKRQLRTGAGGKPD